MRAILVMAVFVVGCGGPALDYARAQNPNCEVTPIESRGNWARVLVTCPDEAPVERTYGK